RAPRVFPLDGVLDGPSRRPRPRVRANRFTLQLDAIRAGAGLGILPCFVGDSDPTLVRLTAPLTELSDHYWLLVHPDLKAVPRVRLLIDWIRGAFKDEKSV